jgi:hypothetical protein
MASPGSPAEAEADLSGLEARIATNIAKQQLNFQRQDALLAEIQRELGTSHVRRTYGHTAVTSHTSPGSGHTHTHTRGFSDAADLGGVSFAAGGSRIAVRGASVSGAVDAAGTGASGRERYGPASAAAAAGTGGAWGASVTTASSRQLEVWKREVEAQRTTIQELRAALVGMQRAKAVADQGEVKVWVGVVCWCWCWCCSDGSTLVTLGTCACGLFSTCCPLLGGYDWKCWCCVAQQRIALPRHVPPVPPPSFPLQASMLERRVSQKDEEIARLRTELTASSQQMAEAQRAMSRIAATYQAGEGDMQRQLSAATASAAAAEARMEELNVALLVRVRACGVWSRCVFWCTSLFTTARVGVGVPVFELGVALLGGAWPCPLTCPLSALRSSCGPPTRIFFSTRTCASD